MLNWLTQLTSEHVRDLTPYESARRLFAASQGQQRVWLNANESPEAPQFEISSELLNRYPDCQPDRVLQAYATYSGLGKQNVVITRGADEGIELLIRAFCTPGTDKVLICPPTYGMYAISANTFNVGCIKAPLNEDFSVDVASVNAAAGKVKLVFLCSPNNPTGTLADANDIISILEAHKDQAIVVLDEAYIEFSAANTQTSLLEQYPNLVILRTLSKGFALAGIRCGFVLASPEIKEILLKVIAPYPVPDPVAQIAAQALTHAGVTAMKQRVDELSSSLASLSKRLLELDGLELVGAQCGNFVLFRHAKNIELMQYLVDNNMLIRNQSKQLMLDNCLRISIGTPAQNAQLFELIEAFFAQENAPLTSTNEAV
ncbi:histidinol-phosphate transaminase [Glaciecola sp. 2405UD65-10]|uniref:histidinol-phosphate transaminase n=1 Tax=Glaciecola sp. 2405UD65-10 TaxID=3397244 RepID=UPI003B5CEA31